MNQKPNTTEKRAVFLGILQAWILSLIFICVGVVITKKFALVQHWTLGKSISFAILCSGFALAAGIGWAARTRHFISNIDGSAPAEGSPLDITLRYISNTLEQSVLFAISCFAFGQAYPEFAQTLLPVMGIWFVIARLLFWFGYMRSPLKRAAGFAATFHPTLILAIAALIGLFLT